MNLWDLFVAIDVVCLWREGQGECDRSVLAVSDLS